MATHRFCLIASLMMTLSLVVSLGCGSRTEVKSGADAVKPVTQRDSSNDPAPGPQTEPPLTIETDDTAAATKLAVPSVDRAGFDTLLAKHKGKIVLVDYWATWCGPCRKKFPHTVALAKEHADDGLVVIGVSLDDEDSQEEVEKFLADQHATFENVRAANGADDFEAFEIPNEAIPCLRLFGRDGQVIKTFSIDPDADNQFTDDDVAEAVKAALAK